jgi:hypothetical protein
MRTIIDAVIRVLMVLLAIFSVVLAARLVLVFFGANLETFPLRSFILSFARSVTITFVSKGEFKTPYQGVFELNTVFTLLLFLLLEPALEKIRRVVGGL